MSFYLSFRENKKKVHGKGWVSREDKKRERERKREREGHIFTNIYLKKKRLLFNFI